jgi:hypothetical protein
VKHSQHHDSLCNIHTKTFETFTYNVRNSGTLSLQHAKIRKNAGDSRGGEPPWTGAGRGSDDDCMEAPPSVRLRPGPGRARRQAEGRGRCTLTVVARPRPRGSIHGGAARSHGLASRPTPALPSHGSSMAAMTPFRGGLEIWVAAWEESKR